MKHHLLILAVFSFLSLFGQTRTLTVEIVNIESWDSTLVDSLRIDYPRGEIFGWNVVKPVPTVKKDGKTSLVHTFHFLEDSTKLKVYFNEEGYVEISHLEALKSDTLTIDHFTVYPNCEQKGSRFRKTVFEIDSEGNIDPFNYKTTVESTMEPLEEECLVPDSLSLTINGQVYVQKVIEKTDIGIVTLGQGETRKFWLGPKKEFYFIKEELTLIRKVSIELK